ncbi:MAG: SMI1/KNR4 family protein [Ktedonobacteraceae bacterium]
MYLDKVKAQLEELHIVRVEKIIPCTEEEVRILERKIRHSLPAAYREFLLWMGQGTGGLFQGSECLYWDLIPLQKAAVKLMQEDEFVDPLPEDAFVFLMHQGYQFHFFRTNEGDDPPIYYYLEEQEQSSIRTVYSHFSDFLLAMVENHAQIANYIASHRPDQPKDGQILQDK